jgi:hypothetical protein
MIKYQIILSETQCLLLIKNVKEFILANNMLQLNHMAEMAGSQVIKFICDLRVNIFLLSGVSYWGV